MRKQITMILAIGLIAGNCLAQQKRVYLSIFKDSRHINCNDAKTKSLFAQAISKRNNVISAEMIKKISLKQTVDLKEYGAADLYLVNLRHYPSVLNANFLVIVNHRAKSINSINIDRYYLIKSSNNQNIIVGFNNIRGNLELLFFNYHQHKFMPSTITDIFHNTDCLKFDADTVNLITKDINHDGYPDVVVVFDELNYCDKDGNDNDTVVSTKRSTKRLLYNPKSEIWSIVSN